MEAQSQVTAPSMTKSQAGQGCTPPSSPSTRASSMDVSVISFDLQRYVPRKPESTVSIPMNSGEDQDNDKPDDETSSYQSYDGFDENNDPTSDAPYQSTDDEAFPDDPSLPLLSSGSMKRYHDRYGSFKPRTGSAAQALLRRARSSTKLAAKASQLHLRKSMGRLATLAQPSSGMERTNTEAAAAAAAYRAL